MLKSANATFPHVDRSPATASPIKPIPAEPNIFQYYHAGQLQALAAYGQVLRDANVDYLIAPTTAATTSPIDSTEPFQLIDGKPADIFAAYAQQFYETGIRVPGVSVPAGLTNGGLPIGIHVNALPG